MKMILIMPVMLMSMRLMNINNRLVGKEFRLIDDSKRRKKVLMKSCLKLMKFLEMSLDKLRVKILMVDPWWTFQTISGLREMMNSIELFLLRLCNVTPNKSRFTKRWKITSQSSLRVKTINTGLIIKDKESKNHVWELLISEWDHLTLISLKLHLIHLL